MREGWLDDEINNYGTVENFLIYFYVNISG